MMKILGKALKVVVSTTILLAVFSANSYARYLPEKSFACQVQAKNGIQGLVLVQVDARKMAFETASELQALTFNGIRSATISVVLWIEVPIVRFTDCTFH